MKNNLRLTQSLENDYEAQLLNDFYNQENENKKEKLEKIKNNYKRKRLQLSIKRYTKNITR